MNRKVNSMIKYTCLLLFAVSGLSGMYEYRLAEPNDIPALLSLMNNQAALERDKLVILPKKFRESALKNAVDKERLFVATKNKTVVGYKKLFLVTDEQEKKELLNNELRCTGDAARRTFFGFVDEQGLITETAEEQENCFDTDQTVYVYDGADFTSPSERSKGINRALTDRALHSLLPALHAHISANDAPTIALLFGLTNANAGIYPGAAKDRTPSIAKSYARFIRALTTAQESPLFLHARYQACMPTFDENSEICCPLPDEQSIPGFGCILAYSQEGSHD